MPYVCSKCKETFEEEWSDEKAMKEAKELFGDIPRSGLMIVCDDCYNKMGFSITKPT